MVPAAVAMRVRPCARACPRVPRGSPVGPALPAARRPPRPPALRFLCLLICFRALVAAAATVTAAGEGGKSY